MQINSPTIPGNYTILKPREALNRTFFCLCIFFSSWKTKGQGFINRNGAIIIDFQFNSAIYFKNGKSEVCINGEKFIIDQNGRTIRNSE